MEPELHLFIKYWWFTGLQSTHSANVIVARITSIVEFSADETLPLALAAGKIISVLTSNASSLCVQIVTVCALSIYLVVVYTPGVFDVIGLGVK